MLLLLLMAAGGKAFSQNTFHIDLYDNSIIGYTREHSDTRLKFTNRPTREGKYIVYEDYAATTQKIFRYFFISKDGELIDKKEYCCNFDVINAAGKNKKNFGAVCDDASTGMMDYMTSYGYSNAGDVDTVVVIAYAKNGQFNKPLQTCKAYTRQHHYSPFGDVTFQKLYLYNSWLSCANDYEITLKNHDRFRIAHIVTRQYMPDSNITGSFCTMYSYEINGRKVIGNTIILVKPGHEKEYSEYEDKSKDD